MRFMMFMIPAVYQGKQGKKASADFALASDGQIHGMFLNIMNEMFVELLRSCTV